MFVLLTFSSVLWSDKELVKYLSFYENRLHFYFKNTFKQIAHTYSMTIITRTTKLSKVNSWIGTLTVKSPNFVLSTAHHFNKVQSNWIENLIGSHSRLWPSETSSKLNGHESVATINCTTYLSHYKTLTNWYVYLQRTINSFRTAHPLARGPPFWFKKLQI